ncbi:S-adenosyl-L-methionine-dependent methyltransferase [Immersiella caudata]|uniref:S-adenosyl-L-methionine-dependent methyltransferase n=1 Tax=Immersiella caudata TaxID=314043 RepID=A0AA39WXA4_9PEZI|nr:S-adenosyl-L-methionine-dependent methyltransferase [Immersiella caudata]
MASHHVNIFCRYPHASLIFPIGTIPSLDFFILPSLTSSTPKVSHPYRHTQQPLGSPASGAMDPSKHAANQYSATSSNLSQRLAIHDWSTTSQSWFSWVRDRLPTSGNLLEVGAGTGLLWQQPDHPLPPNLHLTLTDFSPAMCEELRFSVPSAKVAQCDAASLPFPSASFDVLVANHMLYHLDDPDAALREFARVLRPGTGRLFVALNGEDHLQELFAVGAAIGRASLIKKQARVTLDTAPALLGKYFDDVKQEGAPGAFEVGEAKPVVDYLATVGDGGPLSDEERRVATGLVEGVIRDKGVFTIEKSMVLFEGVSFKSG